MKSKFIFLFLVYLNVAGVAHAQAPANGTSATSLVNTPPGVRPQNGEKDPDKESSSFMGDPSNLDVMKPKKDNLKEDEEPVLEDIRQVLDEPEKKKVEPVPPVSPVPPAAPSEAPSTAQTPSEVPPPSTDSSGLPADFVPKESAAPKKSKKAKALPPKKIKKQQVAKPHVAPVKRNAHLDLQSDDPDYGLEKKFHSIYNTYNAQPTSLEAWGAVLGNRPSEVYIVQKGDTLWSISKTLFGDPNFWPKIWSLNRMGIVNPHFITPGLQVMFYSGSDENVPSLALGTKDSKPAPENGSGKEQSAITSLDGSIQPGIIPDSLPLSRNDNYFLPPKTMQVDLQNDVEAPDEYANDILLTNDAIKSEVDVPIQEVVKGHCGGNHVLKSNIAIPANANFKIYELLEDLKMDVGVIHAYRYVGEAHSMTDSKLKVNSCSTVMSNYLVFVSPDKVPALRATKISEAKEPEILGGPNLGTQNLFSDEQLIYINLGVTPANIGQTAIIQSQVTEENSAKIKILDKFGSVAIGVLTDVSDLVEKGDKVTLAP